MHSYLALTLIGLMVIHVWLHWSWVYTTVKKLLGIKSASSSRGARYGATLLVIIAILTFGGLFWTRSQVNPTSKVVKQEIIEYQSPSPIHISGRTTLAEAAKIGGIPVEKLVFQSQLPADVDADEQLGRLKRQYGFEIEDVRKILEQNKKEVR
jgi:hypothetical protein